ncbi:bumetanide-sensitive sodium-(potassium)-chloride cotransporter [Anabrus simplex]|uniref:bumetanide-sensitive sodium-(potassium)-chloride cotransporter n=1 Tax=Anabrus simplex TaxID=316456 RepID=UPI0034DD76C9
MESRFSVRRVEHDPAADSHQMTEGNVNPAGSTDTLPSAVDIFNSTSTTCLVEPKDRKCSIAHLTLEALPRMDHYRNCMEGLKRPSLGEVHGEDSGEKDVEADQQKGEDHGAGGHGIKLGWIQGVLIPCLLNIWGVMLFLRLSWVVAQSGIGQSLVIIGISAVVCVLTTLSLSAISTNGEVKGGGIYYIISRSLGPEFGASIGVVFAFANAVAASMNTIGFCNSLNDLLAGQGVKIVDGGNNDVRIVGVVAILIMVLICAVGMEWESKAQNLLILIIMGAIVDFIAGAIVGPSTDEVKAQGFPGFSVEVLKNNWGPNYRYSENVDQDFFSVFAIFFPSVTGIQAGANISGDLKDPAAAIPKGTLLALLISMISYAVFVVFAGGAALRDASGNVTDLYNGTLADCIPNCQYGLMNSYSVMQLMSLWGPFIYAGCFAATLSTALTNLLSVPRLIQALGIDKIYPGLIFFSKGYGKNGEPYRGYVLTFFVSSAFLLIAQLNVIAPLISNFYLASYALINFCTFHAALIKPVGWRPTFKYYNLWLSLVGFILCVAIMFLIDWVTSLITFIVIFALYLLVVYRKPDVNWGSSTQAQTYKTALVTAYRLTNISEHVKNYRPQMLVLSGKPSARPPLMGLANLITRHNALLVCGEVIPQRLSYRERNVRIRNSYQWLQGQKIKAFYSVLDGIGFEEGARALLQSSGIGKLKPNVLLMGYKSDWRECNSDDLLAYFNVLHNAFDNRVAATILRLDGGLDYSRITDEYDGATSIGASNGDLTINNTTNIIRPEIMRTDSNLSYLHSGSNHGSDTSIHLRDLQPYLPTDSITSQRRYNLNEKSTHLGSPKSILRSKKKAIANQILKGPGGQEIPREILANMTFFDRKHKGGTIDVWWLYDDGGLTILLPYIIHLRHNWTSCKLRVFALANRHYELELEERNMANLLSKFRIDYSSLTMMTGITEKPKQETVDLFNSLLNGFRESDGAHEDCSVTETELVSLSEKTNRQLRLREMLQESSKDAALVVMSLPMPRKGTLSAPLYMAWLEILSRDMPPFLFVRGNHTSVLTFYS